jgi:putative ABC transport system ATP-binding protein
MGPVIRACHVHKSFGAGAARTTILHGVSMEVNAGEIVFLVGPSGSGKSTLLSILGCLLTPDQGQVELFGEEVSRLDPAALTAFRAQRIGFVFQSFNLFPTLSTLDNVCLALSMRGVPLRQARRRALEVLGQVGLAQRVLLLPAQLSTGECQRVAIARALVHAPQVLFADEPTASLDTDNGQTVLKLLNRLVRARGMALVVVTHDNRIFSFSDRILHLENGRLVDAGVSSRPSREKRPGAILSLQECVL